MTCIITAKYLFGTKGVIGRDVQNPVHSWGSRHETAKRFKSKEVAEQYVERLKAYVIETEGKDTLAGQEFGIETI